MTAPTVSIDLLFSNMSRQKASVCTMTFLGTCPGAVCLFSILVILAIVSVKQSHQKRQLICTMTSAGTCPCAVCLVGILVILVSALYVYIIVSCKPVVGWVSCYLTLAVK
jgi:hypothetical protein